MAKKDHKEKNLRKSAGKIRTPLLQNLFQHPYKFVNRI